MAATGSSDEGLGARAMNGSFTTLDVTETGTVATVRFSRPEERNTATVEMLDELYAALAGLAPREDLAAVILTGSGTTFCPGADVKMDFPPDPSARLVANDESYHLTRLLVEMPQVSVAAVNGGCAGAGFAFASACDLRIASSRARFATAFLNIGLAGELGLAWTLQHHLGGAVARELSLMPGKFDAERARSIGFVARVIDADSWDDELAAFTAELAGRKPEALRGIKQNFLDAMRLPLGEFIEVEGARHRAWFEGENAAATLASLEAHGRGIGTGAG
jgi:2-(1,2-epoxy-1,2-dihydrophenyl)acetyl-CoA isomerase